MKHFFLALTFIGLTSATSHPSLAQEVPVLKGPWSPLIKLEKGDQIRLASWNIYKGQDQNFASEFLKLAESSDIMLLQEAFLTQEQKKILESPRNSSWVMAEAWKKNGISTGTATVSKYQFKEAIGILSRDGQPITNTPKSSVILKIPISSLQDLLVVNTHAINFTFNGPFERQLNVIKDIIATHYGPVLWAGDFNTWRPARRNILYKLSEELALQSVEFKNDPRSLVLDHVFVRGLTVEGALVLDHYNSSDHWPLYVLLNVD